MNRCRGCMSTQVRDLLLRMPPNIGPMPDVLSCFTKASIFSCGSHFLLSLMNFVLQQVESVVLMIMHLLAFFSTTLFFGGIAGIRPRGDLCWVHLDREVELELIKRLDRRENRC